MIDYQKAVEIARRYANDQPCVPAAHINGLCDVLEAVGKERDALSVHVGRLYETFKTAETWEDVHEVFESKPESSLARLIEGLADQLEAAEAPDAEAGDMWDAGQCADWLREHAKGPTR